MKIVAVDPISLFPEHLKAIRETGELKIYDNKPENNQEILERIKDAEVVIDYWTAIPAEVMSKLQVTKLICCASSGYDWIDVETASKAGITVSHCPGHNSEAVAEHTVGLLLAAARKTIKSAEDMKSGKFAPDDYPGKEIKGRNIGIIGYGMIGQRIGEILEKGFGAKILSVDINNTKNDLEDLLRNSDFISVNVPLNDKTRKMLGEKEFELMKQDVVLVNTSRGAVIDEEVLLKYLRSEKVFAAGLDVLAQEPNIKDNPLFNLSNVVITPHIGWNTENTGYRLSEQVAQIVTSFANGNPIFKVPEQRK
jgi:lactate dehydrogenase-like 2-hydroxyacid dehydrogenase